MFRVSAIVAHQDGIRLLYAHEVEGLLQQGRAATRQERHAVGVQEHQGGKLQPFCLGVEKGAQTAVALGCGQLAKTQEFDLGTQKLRLSLPIPAHLFEAIFVTAAHERSKPSGIGVHRETPRRPGDRGRQRRGQTADDQQSAIEKRQQRGHPVSVG